MKKTSKKDEKEVVAVVCVCGATPCTVKHKSRYMLSCPRNLECSMRGSWHKKQQDAVKSWNTAVESAKHLRKVVN